MGICREIWTAYEERTRQHTHTHQAVKLSESGGGYQPDIYSQFSLHSSRHTLKMFHMVFYSVTVQLWLTHVQLALERAKACFICVAVQSLLQKKLISSVKGFNIKLLTYTLWQKFVLLLQTGHHKFGSMQLYRLYTVALQFPFTKTEAQTCSSITMLLCTKHTPWRHVKVGV